MGLGRGATGDERSDQRDASVEQCRLGHESNQGSGLKNRSMGRFRVGSFGRPNADGFDRKQGRPGTGAWFEAGPPIGAAVSGVVIEVEVCPGSGSLSQEHKLFQFGSSPMPRTLTCILIGPEFVQQNFQR